MTATRAAVDVLLETLAMLDDREPLPSWVQMPPSEAHFAAALIARAPFPVTPVYDADDRLVALQGIRLKAAS